MVDWHKHSIVLLLIMILAGCSPTIVENIQEEQTQEEIETQPDSATVAPIETTTISIQDVEATTGPTVEAVLTLVPADVEVELVEEEMPPTSAANRSSSSGNRFTETAVADLAQRLSINEDLIQIVSFESVVWPDSGMGCPQPGMMYTQVLREGYKITLEYKGQQYNYHGGEGRDPFLCENKQQIDDGDGATFVPPPNMDE